jgi:hypothetical protein
MARISTARRWGLGALLLLAGLALPGCGASVAPNGGTRDAAGVRTPDTGVVDGSETDSTQYSKRMWSRPMPVIPA